MGEFWWLLHPLLYPPSDPIQWSDQMCAYITRVWWLEATDDLRGLFLPDQHAPKHICVVKYIMWFIHVCVFFLLPKHRYNAPVLVGMLDLQNPPTTHPPTHQPGPSKSETQNAKQSWWWLAFASWVESGLEVGGG